MENQNALLPEQIPIKSNLYEKLKKLNKKNNAFEEIIKHYQKLMEKYNNIRQISDNKGFSRAYSFNNIGNANNMSQSDLIKNLRLTENELKKYKESNQSNLENLSQRLNEVLELKKKIEIYDKEISQIKPKCEFLEAQNVQLKTEKSNLEALVIKQKNQIVEMTLNQNDFENEKNRLNQKNNLLEEENKVLKEKLSKLKEELLLKLNEYNDLIESSKQKRKIADIYFSETLNEYEKKENNKLYNIVEKTKIPNKLKFSYKPNSKKITSLNFTNSGSNFMISSDNLIKYYDASKNNEISIFPFFNSEIIDSCFDYSEKCIFACSDKIVKLFNIKNNKFIYDFKGHNDEITCIKSLINQDKGITGSKDRTIKEWDFKTGKLINSINCKNPCNCINIINKNNNFLSGHSNGLIHLWNINNKNSEKTFDGNDIILNIETFKKDNQFLIINSSSEIKLFDLRKETKPVYTIDNKVIKEFCNSNISVSDNMKFFTVGSQLGNIFIFNLDNGEIINCIENKIKNPITKIKWRPHHSYIYSGDSEGNLSIWVDN